jgi:hypothetical protein
MAAAAEEPEDADAAARDDVGGKMLVEAKARMVMKKYLVLLLFAMTVTACAEERTVVRDNSASTKFTSLFSGDSRWQVSDGGDAKPAKIDKDQPVVLQDAPSNFSGYHIVTSFQTDDRGTPGAMGGQRQGDTMLNAPYPSADPWTVPSTRPAGKP